MIQRSPEFAPVAHLDELAARRAARERRRLEAAELAVTLQEVRQAVDLEIARRRAAGRCINCGGSGVRCCEMGADRGPEDAA